MSSDPFKDAIEAIQEISVDQLAELKKRRDNETSAQTKNDNDMEIFPSELHGVIYKIDTCIKLLHMKADKGADDLIPMLVDKLPNAEQFLSHDILSRLSILGDSMFGGNGETAYKFITFHTAINAVRSGMLGKMDYQEQQMHEQSFRDKIDKVPADLIETKINLDRECERYETYLLSELKKMKSVSESDKLYKQYISQIKSGENKPESNTEAKISRHKIIQLNLDNLQHLRSTLNNPKMPIQEKIQQFKVDYLKSKHIFEKNPDTRLMLFLKKIAALLKLDNKLALSNGNRQFTKTVGTMFVHSRKTDLNKTDNNRKMKTNNRRPK